MKNITGCLVISLKNTIKSNENSPAFAVNRGLCVMINEAFYTL
ncbi:MAG: hypothetical protein U9P80_07010 [Thermodesulfobacteriota bacterium]|nr:hypothetical protein [Thermodesulfobacteriota bacterium]